MTYEELNNFTYEELSSFTCLELSKDKYELLFKNENNSLPLPQNIQDKLYKLCGKIKENLPEEKKPIFAKIKFDTLGNAIKVFHNIVILIKDFQFLKPYLISFFNEIFSYVSEHISD